MTYRPPKKPELWDKVRDKTRHRQNAACRTAGAREGRYRRRYRVDRRRLKTSGYPADNPGRVMARRLNRVEYNNTIRDLLGVPIRPADEFPVDDSGYGFDNIGDVLTVSPMLMEKYLAAAAKRFGVGHSTDHRAR